MSRGGRLGGQGPDQYRNSPLNGFGRPMPRVPMGSPQMNPNKGGSRMSLADMQAPGGYGGPSPLAQAKFPPQNDYAVGRPNMDILTGNYAAPGFEQAPRQQFNPDIGAVFNEMVAPGLTPAQPNNSPSEFLGDIPAVTRREELMPVQQSYPDIGAGFNQMVAPGIANPQREALPQQIQPQLMAMQPQRAMMQMQPQRAMMQMQSQRFDPLMSRGLASLPISRSLFMR